MTVDTRQTFCRICEALCGLEADVATDADGTERVVDVRPDASHVVTDGFACIKGLRQHQMYASEDRLRRPRMRDPHGGYREATWSQALSSIGTKVRQLRREHGPQSIAMYVGTAAGFSVLHPIFAQGFMTGLGSTNMYATATQDCANKFSIARDVYGFPFLQPFPDLEHTDCLIIVGANPAVSKWSFGQVSNPVARLRQIERRGGRVFVVDPRRTETAKAAGEHVFIRPNTDLFFFAAFLNELIAQGGIDWHRVDSSTTGFTDVEALVRPWTPERAEQVTAIPAQTLRQMVAAYRQANGAAMYSSTGVNMGREGSLSFWLQEVINVASGNLDRRGGTIVGRGLVDFPGFAHKHGILMRSERSRVGGIGTVNDAFPGGVLADEILTEGRDQVRALFVTGGNPLLTMPNAGRLRQAFERLELLVVLDIVHNETASIATHVLPCTTPFERPDLPFLFPLFLGMQSRPYLQATKALVPPDAEQRDETSIYIDLAKACGVSIFGSRIAQLAMQQMTRLGGAEARQERLLSLLLRLGRAGSFRKLASEKHGRKLRPQGAGDFIGRRVLTEDGRIHLGPQRLLAAARERMEPLFEREVALAAKGVLKLITKRAVGTHNSWTHNHPRMVTGKRRSNYLYMNPEDAAARGIAPDDIVDVATRTSRVRLPVVFLDDLMPGTVALPHGWGHQHARGLTVASATEGVNVNLLAADGPDSLDALSGMAQLTGFDVVVTPAQGPRNTRSWSGI